MLAAVIGGGITAAALLGAGVVDGDRRTVIEPAARLQGRAGAGASAGGGLSAREIYKRDAPGVVFVRAQTLRTDPSPFDVFGTTAARRSRPARAS